ncbi:MAG: diversity-generating retroelement protein Avd [Planctomycetaceae bacterium]|nr:diversity-generating retroelement protein Avd [Planctomycetaceae bacterium]
MQAERTPIFVRTYDFILWLLPHTARWPKHLRHSLTGRLEGAMLDFQGAILRANRLRGEARLRALDEADGLLDGVRILVRLATDLRCLSARQYQFAAEKTVEIGRLLGAWRKATEAGR